MIQLEEVKDTYMQIKFKQSLVMLIHYIDQDVLIAAAADTNINDMFVDESKISIEYVVLHLNKYGWNLNDRNLYQTQEY